MRLSSPLSLLGSCKWLPGLGVRPLQAPYNEDEEGPAVVRQAVTRPGVRQAGRQAGSMGDEWWLMNVVDGQTTDAFYKMICG